LKGKEKKGREKKKEKLNAEAELFTACDVRANLSREDSPREARAILARTEIFKRARCSTADKAISPGAYGEERRFWVIRVGKLESCRDGLLRYNVFGKSTV